jgi:hypothetical protein
MLIDPHLARELAQHHMKDLMREAEQERLIRRVAGGSKTSRSWPPVVTLIFSSLLNLVSVVRS